jgi:acetylornithine deacetylase/succinyl-diaminopimelate desuccinylase-like protein
MIELLRRLVDIPSPFGEERPIAEFLVGTMAGCGLDAELQPMAGQSANAIGRLRPAANDGPSLLMFAPLDSPFTGRPEDELPWVGDALPPHMVAKAIVGEGTVTGLSADNPKAHITAAIAAAAAVRQAGARLSGGVTLAFGAGGAPANKRPGQDRSDVGHGAGCRYLLIHGVGGDFAIICKPGYAVAWEEVGLTWFRIRVRGVQTYVGRRHFLAYRNPIEDAATIVAGLTAWFPEYSARHTDGLCAPQGAVGAIEGGWTYKPAFIPAACDIYVDMRISPRMTAAEARAELEAALAAIKAKNPGLRYDVETLVAVEGPATDPRNWIVQSCIRAWEDVEQRPHRPFLNTSGQTEAVILRANGIPTARIGLPAAMGQTAEKPHHTMGEVAIADVRKLAACLIYAIVDTCTRSRETVGASRR